MVFYGAGGVTFRSRESSNGGFALSKKGLAGWFHQDKRLEGVAMENCTHLSQIKQVTPHSKGCEECLKMGDTWVHLRLCMECGHVGCCDSSKNKHATKHFHRSKHPIMKSLEPGETWGWCYVDELELDFA